MHTSKNCLAVECLAVERLADCTYAAGPCCAPLRWSPQLVMQLQAALPVTCDAPVIMDAAAA